MAAAAETTRQAANPRRCALTGHSAPREGLVRFAVGPEGALVPDVEERLPGRGLWLTARRDIVGAAAASRRLAKAAGGPVRVPDGIADIIERLLRRRCLAHFGLARRAGLVTTGFERVRARLRDGEPAAVLVEASDGAEDGRRRLRPLAQGALVADDFTSEELSQALGRGNVVHALVAPGRIAETLARDLARLRGISSARADEGEAGRNGSSEDDE